MRITVPLDTIQHQGPLSTLSRAATVGSPRASILWFISGGRSTQYYQYLSFDKISIVEMLCFLYKKSIEYKITEYEQYNQFPCAKY